MPIARVQLSIPSQTGIPADAATNSWHFFADDLDGSTISSIKSALVTFYEALDTYKSDEQAWALTTYKFFDLSDPEPRYPVDEGVLGLSAAPSASALPRELAICLSFHGDFGSGEPSGRRRGRVYFGPLSVVPLNSDGQVTSAAVTAFASAGTNLLSTSTLASGWSWGVYSRADSALWDVTGGWVDNSFDVQRRREQKPSLRTNF